MTWNGLTGRAPQLRSSGGPGQPGPLTPYLNAGPKPPVVSKRTASPFETEGKFTKFIRLWKGGFGFEFRKKPDEQFRLTSPTAVASIRGTRGMLSGGAGSDTLIITEGTVRFANNVSNREIDVAAGNIGVSSQDGSISSRRATTKELAEADRLATGGTLNELKLELRDKQGNKKELKLKYKQ